MSAAFRGLILPTTLTLIVFAILVSLGNWQLDRLAWKEDLIDRVESRIGGEPLDLRSEDIRDIGDPSSFLETNEYRPALLTGIYAADQEVLVFTSLSDAKGALSGPGYWVFTPLVTSPSGTHIFINRGFVPEEQKRALSPPPAGQVTVQGALRAAEEGNWFTPDPNLDERVFFARDPMRIAKTLGSAAPTVGFFIDLDASQTPPSGLPQAGETRTMFANSHLGYAFTWYGLAAALLAVFASFVWTRSREGSQAPRLTRPGGTP